MSLSVIGGSAPDTWAHPCGRMTDTVDVEVDLIAAFARAAAFLDPLLAGRRRVRVC